MRSECDQRDLLDDWNARFNEPVHGWDFAGLADEISAVEPDWSYSSMARELLIDAEHTLDMGTGGGELLVSLRDALPDDTVATEGWSPNIGVAAETLGPHGIDVVAYDAETDSAMPFGDDRFDLVLNRHEAYDPHEVHRVLAPKGFFLTQQVDGRTFEEALELFGGSSAYPEVTVDRSHRDFEAAGLIIERAAESVGKVTFSTVSAMVRYFAIVPWEVADAFSVDRYAKVLLDLHDADRSLTFTSRHFVLRARPAKVD